MANLDASDLILIIIAFFFPPVTAVITDGCGGQFALNVSYYAKSKLLTLLGFLPGLIHAIWLVLRRAERETKNGTRVGAGGSGFRGDNRNNANNAPIYVQQPGGYQQGPPVEAQANYGTMGNQAQAPMGAAQDYQAPMNAGDSKVYNRVR